MSSARQEVSVNIRNSADRIVYNAEGPLSQGSRRYHRHTFDAREFLVISERDGSNADVHGGAHRHTERDNYRGMDHETSFDALLY